MKITRKENGTTLVQSEKTIFTFCSKTEIFEAFTNAKITSAMADDFNNSKLVEVRAFDTQKGFIYFKKRDFFEVNMFEDLIGFIFAKYEL